MSVRNNEERFGAKKVNSDPPPQVETQATEGDAEGTPSAPLSFSTPTEYVDLPSKGEFYPPGHPLHKQDSLEIRYMTARDEDILTSKSLLKKGVAIDRFLQNIIVNRNVAVESLLVGDKNALIVAARVTGYGTEYKTKMPCPSCGANVTNEFNLENATVKEATLEEGVERTPKGTFVLKTPRGGTTVEIKLLTGADERRLSKLVEVKRKKNLPESTLSDQLRLAIVSVNGIGEPNMLNMFMGSLPAYDARYMRDIYANLMPNVDMRQDFECPSCGYEQEMEVPFTSDFFWPK